MENNQKKYVFCLLAYINAYPRRKELLQEPLEYYISTNNCELISNFLIIFQKEIEKVLFPGFPSYVLQQIALIIFLTGLLSFLLFKFFMEDILNTISKIFNTNSLKSS